jgi:hypothetical protein
MSPCPCPLRHLAGLGLAVLLAGCGDDGARAVDAPGVAPIDAGPTPDGDGAARTGLGGVEVIEAWTVTDLGAGPTPQRWADLRARFYQDHEPRWHHEVMQAGACRMVSYAAASCDPACLDGRCVATNVCEPYPVEISAGRLTVSGLATTVEIDPVDTLYVLGQQLPAELFADGATITASVAGAALPALSLTTTGVPALQPGLTGDVVAAGRGQDLTLTWTPSTDPSARVRLTYNANNRGHGAPYDAIITCEVADADGTLTVPAAMMDTFPATTAWRICAGRDCPPSTLRRFHHVATPALAGEVGLTVASEYYFFVDHPGP